MQAIHIHNTPVTSAVTLSSGKTEQTAASSVVAGMTAATVPAGHVPVDVSSSCQIDAAAAAAALCPFLAGRKTAAAAESQFRRIEEHYPLLASTGCTREQCQSGRMVHTDEPRVGLGYDCAHGTVEAEAVDFLRQLRRDGFFPSDAAFERRVAEVRAEIWSENDDGIISNNNNKNKTNKNKNKNKNKNNKHSGTWWQTPQELEQGLRLAWKHARKCIMRSEHATLRLFDFRHIKTSREMGQVLLQGLKEAFNGGNIQPSAFVFPPRQPGHAGPMVWNQQLLAFAGYEQPNGSVLGDPANVGLTKAILGLGWQPPAFRSQWDLLPLVTMADGDEAGPTITAIPDEAFPLVRIRHPDGGQLSSSSSSAAAVAFDRLGLRWVPAPALSQLGFDIGGVQYTAAPFVGWFMDAEIGTRDLADRFRYNVLPAVSAALHGGRSSSSRSRNTADIAGNTENAESLEDLPQYEQLARLSMAQTELTRAVFWSFAQAGVRMSDSLTASAMYCTYDDQHLQKHGFRLPADPYWLAPPQGSIVPLWHRGAAPNYQPKPMICRLSQMPCKLWETRPGRGRPAAAADGNDENNAQAANKKRRPAGLANLADLEHAIPGLDRPSAADGQSSASTFPGSLPAATRTVHIYYCSAGTTAQRLARKLERHLQTWSWPSGIRSRSSTASSSVLGGWSHCGRSSRTSRSSSSSSSSTSSTDSSEAGSIFSAANGIASTSSAPPVIAAPAVLNALDVAALEPNDVVFVVASNVGRGDVPPNGLDLLKQCQTLSATTAGCTFAIFGNGNSSYSHHFNGAALKIRAALQTCGLAEAVPLQRADTLKEDPPWQQFGEWLQVVRSSLALPSAMRGGPADASLSLPSPSDTHMPTFDEELETLDLRIPHLEGLARFVSAKGAVEVGKGMRKVVLQLASSANSSKSTHPAYRPMSHVDVFVPLADTETTALVHALGLSGAEEVYFGGRTATTRQLLSLVDIDRPFSSLGWTAGLSLLPGQPQLHTAALLEKPVRETVLASDSHCPDLPSGWPATIFCTGKDNDALLRFLAALHFRRPRVFSTASAPSPSSPTSPISPSPPRLDLLVQTRPGGLFSDVFLSRATPGAPLYVRFRSGPAEHLAGPGHAAATAPLIAFATGSGIAPLCSLLQARRAAAANAAPLDTAIVAPVTLLIGCRQADTQMVHDCIGPAVADRLIDTCVLVPSNQAGRRVQDHVLFDPRDSPTSRLLHNKIRNQAAHVFVCASKAAADGFAANLAPLMGVPNIREALGPRWLEEVFSA